MPVLRPCLDCGTLTAAGTRCSSCKSRRERSKNRASPYQTPTWRRIRKARRKAGHDSCAVCGSTHYVAQHHVDNVTAGGAIEGETVALCASCHGRYEADVRADRDSPLRRLVDRLARRQPG